MIRRLRIYRDASPFTFQPDVCHKLSQTFGRGFHIDFKIVPALKEVSRCKRRPFAFLGDESAGPVSSVTRGCTKNPGTFR